MEASPTRQSKVAPPRSRRLRLLCWLVLLLLPVAAGGWLGWRYLTSSAFLCGRLEPVLSDLAGGDVDLHRVNYRGDGRFVIEGAAIRVPGVSGEPGELARLETLEAWLDEDALWRGRVVARRIVAEGVTLRLSEDVEGGRFNFGGLRFDAGANMDQPAILPTVEVRDVTVITGEHRGSAFHPVGRLELEGTLRPQPRQTTAKRGGRPGPPVYQLDVHERNPEAGAEALSLSGTIDPETWTCAVTFRGLSFHDRRAAVLPAMVRRWWSSIDPQGSLGPVAVEVDGSGRYRVEIVMEGLDWSLPVSETVTEPAPRMTGVQGSVILHDGGVDLVGLTGRIDGVEYDLRGRIDSVDREPGFSLDFAVRQFDLARHLSVLVALPDSMREWVDRQIESLGRPEGVVSARVHVERAPPEAEEPRSLRIDGRVELVDASLRYDQFPYPLRDLDGAIEFDNEQVRIVSMAGRGPGDATIMMSGRISPPGPDPQVDVEIYALNAALDETLRGALKPHHQKAWDLFLDRSIAEALREEGVFLDQESAEAPERRLAALNRTAADNGTFALQEAAELDALRETVDRPRFSIGGVADLAIQIRRDPGPDQPVKVATTMKLKPGDEPVGLIYRDFPYPVYVTQGTLRVGYDRIEILDDLLLRSPNGTTGRMTGHIDRVHRPKQRLEPRLHLALEGAPVDRLLLHAIPGKSGPTPGERARALSAGARVLAGLGLSGRLNAEGEIFTREDRSAAFEVRIDVADGATRTMRWPWLTPDAWTWPIDYPLADVHGTTVVRRGEFEIVALEGRHDDQTFHVAGMTRWADGKASLDLDVDARNVEIHPRLIDIFAGLGDDARLDAVRRAWDEHDPGGRMDLTLAHRRAMDGRNQSTIRLAPRDVDFDFDGLRIGLRRAEGAAVVDGDRVRFEGLSADVWADDALAGRLRLRGEVGLDDSGMIDLTGSLTGAPLESTLLAAGMAKVNHGRVGGVEWSALRPQGNLNADFELSRDDASDSVDYQALLRADSLSFDWEGQRVAVTDLDGTVAVGPQRVRLDGLRGRFDDGWFAVDGEVAVGSGSTELALEGEAAAGSRLRAILPRGAASLFSAVQMHESSRLRLDAGRFVRAAHPDGTATWSFDGKVGLIDAAFDVGLPIAGAAGLVDLHLSHRPGGRWLVCDGSAHFDRLRASGREVTDVSIRVVDGETDGLLLVPHLAGTTYEGRLAGQGRVQTAREETPGAYEFQFNLAGVDVAPFLADAIEGDQRRVDTAVERAGRLFADLSVAGLIGRPETRVGRGAVRVVDARLFQVPLAMWALQLSSLALPVATSFDYADMAFFIQGDDVVFERLFLESPTVALNGEGRLNYKTKALDIEFTSTSKMRAPVLTVLWEKLRDSVVSIHVTGTLDAPESHVRGAGAARAGGDGKIGGRDGASR